MFSNWFFRWISRAIVTPSLVTTGEPVIFSRMTLRPLGPRVDLTASASWSTPASSRPRASAPKRSSLAIVAPFQEMKFQVMRSRDKVLRDEDRTPAHAARVEVGEGVGRGAVRIDLRVQGNLAAL